MAGAKLRLSAAFIMAAAQKPEVRTALAKKRNEAERAIHAEAAADDGPPIETQTSEGTRPKGRPYARVSMPFSDEWGDGSYPKRRIAARVAGRLNSAR